MNVNFLNLSSYWKYFFMIITAGDFCRTRFEFGFYQMVANVVETRFMILVLAGVNPLVNFNQARIM